MTNWSKKQKILDISNDTTLFIGSDGHSTIRCQIKEISQNHAGRKFKVLIAADTVRYPQNSDVSWCQSPNILVKSKISKRNRERMKLKQEEQLRLAALATKTSKVAGNKRKCVEDGRAIRSISPANLPFTSEEQSGINASYAALLEFTGNTMKALESIKSQCSLNSFPSEVIEEILTHHRALSTQYSWASPPHQPLPHHRSAPAHQQHHVSFDDGYQEVFGRVEQLENSAQEGGEGVMLTPVANGQIEDDFDGFRLQAHSVTSLGPTPSREHSLFLQLDSNNMTS